MDRDNSETDMKTKLTIQTPALTILVAIIAFATTSMPLVTRAADNVGAAKVTAGRVSPPAIDPNTGLPLPPEVWIDPDWKNPDKVLPEVNYDGLPLAHIADQLRKEFNNAFDVLIPSAWIDPHNALVSIDPQSISVKMELRKVTASEVFNAMNLMFEAENTPCRWELKFNGNRPTAILRVLPQLLPVVAVPPPPPPPTRKVHFVGDLIGDEKSGGLSMEKLVKTVSELYQMSYGPIKGMLQFHKETQLLVFTGTSDQSEFIQATLSALRMKAQADRKQQVKPQ
jgi:hypothetical protein